MRKLLVLFALTFAIFACSNDCLNVANECLNGRYSEKKDNENNQSNDNNSNKEEPGKRFTTLQEVVDKTNAGEEIDLSDYELIDYNATIDKKITIKNGSLSNAKLTVTSENVKLESLTDLSVLASSRLTISESKLSSLLIGGNSETSRSRASEPQMSLAMVSLTDSEIAEVQLNGFNSQLNITDTDTKIDDIVTSTKSKIILEAGKYEGMKDPVVIDNGELTRIDMTKDKTLSILSIYSNPNKAEYKLNEEIDLTGLIVMGTYTASVEIFKSGGWKGEAIESVTKWEDEKDYDVDYDFSKTGVRIVTIKSTVAPDVACNFYVYVVDDSQNGETSKPEKIEFTNIRVESLLQTPKTSYKVGEKLDLSGYRVMGTYNGLDVNLQYTSDPANGTVLSEGGEITVTFYYNGTSVAINDPIKISVAQPYIVTFKVGNDVYCTTEMAHGENLKLPSDPNRENYTFAGWYIGDKNVTSEYIVKSNLELIAKWEADGYTITYNLNGGTNNIINPASYNVETATIKLENATKTGYTFGGWYTDEACTEAKTEIVKGSIGAVILYAKWTANKYTVKFNANGGKGEMTVQTFTYDIEQALTANTFTRGDYTFAGWSIHEGSSAVEYEDKESVINLTEENNGTITLYAQWIEKGAYKITYELDSGANNTKNPNAYKDSSGKIDLYNPTKTGYNFEGWYTDKDFTVKILAISEDSTGDITLYAKWKIETYTITYNNCDGATNANNPASYNVESGTITLAEATKTGYTFVGWYTDEACTEANKVTEIAKGYTGNLTLYAQWEANKYTVQFNANGGSGTMADQTFAYDEQKALTANSFACTGYTFAGWNTQANGSGTNYSDKASVKNLAPNGEVTLYAKWTAVSYTITYNLNGGTNATTNPASYNIETDTIKLTDATKTGYTFGGWYTDEACTETKKVTQIAKGSTGNLTLYAQWAEAEANAYYVSSSSGSDNNSGTSTAHPFETVQKAVDKAITSNDGETTYKIYVMDDITGEDDDFDTTNCALINIDPTEKLNLKISGYNNTVKTINAQQKGRVMFIYGEANVTLENITLTGGKVNNNFGAGVVVSYFGELTMKTGTTISNCKAETSNNSYGGGVYVYGGTFDMFDGTISNCTASYGGGVSVEEGTFTMYGGSIENCKSDGWTDLGGGVHVAGGTFSMKDGIISNCTSEQGGGVYVADGKITMEGGTISNCTAITHGGGVYLASTVENAFTMEGGTISECKADNPSSNNDNCYGGGVYLASNTTFKMTGGTISKCEVKNSCSNKNAYGGGVYLGGSATFEMSGGTIGGADEKSGNIATSTSTSGTALGAGVDVCGTFIMSGGSIKNNKLTNGSSTLSGGGAGVAVEYLSGKFQMSGGVIESNTMEGEKVYGGGVFVNGSSQGSSAIFEISKSAVVNSNNDVYLAGTTKITITAQLTPPEGINTVAKITPSSYSTDRQVLTSSGYSFSSDQVSKFELTPSSDGKFWIIDTNGKLKQQ